jgi:hypothetical protein
MCPLGNFTCQRPQPFSLKSLATLRPYSPWAALAISENGGDAAMLGVLGLLLQLTLAQGSPDGLTELSLDWMTAYGCFYLNVPPSLLHCGSVDLLHQYFPARSVFSLTKEIILAKEKTFLKILVSAILPWCPFRRPKSSHCLTSKSHKN